MNRKLTIAVDVDDVIAAHASAFVEWSNKKYGTHLTVDDYNDHWGEMWKVDLEVTTKRAIEYHDSGIMKEYAIIPGALDVLKELKQRFKLVVLTTRRKVINEITKEWIDRYYPGIFEDIVLSGFFDSLTKESFKLTKGDLAKKIGADFLIDDQLRHVEAAAELGIKGLLFGDYFWNKKDILPPNVTRVKNWQEVKDYFADII